MFEWVTFTKAQYKALKLLFHQILKTDFNKTTQRDVIMYNYHLFFLL